MTKRFSADVRLKHKPRTGKQAYNMLVRSLSEEIKEKQTILSELADENIKREFIANWNADTRSVNICNG